MSNTDHLNRRFNLGVQDILWSKDNPMKIINETCYNTEDIRNLWNACRAAHASENTYHSSEPDTLQVGYCSYGEGNGHIRYQSYRRHKPPRLAIVRPKQLPLTPLQHLATAAEGVASATLPQSVVDNIIEKFRSAAGGYGSIPTTPAWRNVRSMQIRFDLRAKRGSLAQAKAEAKKIKLDAMRAKKREADSRIKSLRYSLNEAITEAEHIAAKIVTLEQNINGA